jgi:hypothetical protein
MGGADSSSHAETDSEPSNDVAIVAASVVKRGRKSVNKAIERVQETIDAANIPLPETPVPVYVSMFSQWVEADLRSARIQNAANEVASQALVPAQNLSRDLTTRFSGFSDAVVKFTGDQMHRFEVVVRQLRDVSPYTACN